jgi:hypothetical protein
VGWGAPELLPLPAPASLADATRLVDVAWRQIGDDALLEARLEVS